MSTVMEQPGGDVTETGRRGRGLMVGAAVGVVVLVGGGALAATQLLASGGEQPDTVLPASAAFYARFDVDPSAGQKVAAVRFFQGLDEETRARLDEGEWREWVWEKLQEEGDVPADLDFATDVEPWLGDRAGVAVLPRGEEEPIVAVALQVKDGEQALETLDRLKAESQDAEAAEQMAYYLDDDYVIFTQAETLEELQAAAEEGVLADNEVYTDDMAELGDAGIASVWADAARIGDLAPAAMANPALGAAGALEGIGDEADMLTGRMAAAVRLSTDSIEVHGLSRGVEGMALPTGDDSARLVSQLPADTAGALSLENGADWVQAAWDYYAATFPEEVEEAAAAAEEQGFTLPDDLKTVLGDSMALSVGPDVVSAFQSMSETSTAMPALPIGYRVATDTAALVTMLSDAGVPPAMLAQRTDDGVLTIGPHQPYVDALAAPEGTTLGDDATFRAAVADPDEADSVFYVNVNPFEEYYLPEVEEEQVRTSLEALAAVGMSTTVEDDSQSRFTLRLVADEE
jgi:hypothetical protein